MPDLLNRSLEDMLAAMAGQFQVRWPNPWWPTGNAAYDDCAACVSYFLFGLNSSRNPFYSYVSQLQNYFAGQGRRTWGNKGIQRGDVLAFSWTQDANSFDHTEIALGPVSPAGLITSRGTNSNPGDDMRDRTRSAAYVVSYSRPAYPGTSAAGLDARPITEPQQDPKNEDEDMPKPIYYLAADNGGLSVNVGKDDVWVRNAPGEPLHRMTQGQWADFNTVAAGLIPNQDYFYKPGSWFGLAFAEDNLVHGWNVSAHPWLNPAAPQTIDLTALAASIATQIGSTPAGAAQDELREIQAQLGDVQKAIANVPDAVRENIKTAL